MANLFQFDIPLLASELVLLVMGFLSLVFSLSLYSKSRDMEKLPKNLSVKIFHKTFNVFDPYPDRRKAIQSSIATLSVIILSGAFIFAFMATKIIEMGFLLSFIIFTICATLMVLEEAFEIHKHADIFIKAIENGADLGQGDLTALSIVKGTLPKLRMYYLSLATIFFVSSIMLPYILPATIWVFAKFVGTLIELTASEEIFAPYYALFLFIVATVMAKITTGKIKRKIFSFPPAKSLVSLNKPFEAMKQWVKWHMHELLHRPPPEPDEIPDSEREKA